LTETQQDAVGVGAAVLQSLAHRLGDEVGRMVAVQLQDADELPHPPPIGPFLPQMGQQLLVDGGPGGPPAPNGPGVVEGAGSSEDGWRRPRPSTGSRCGRDRPSAPGSGGPGRQGLNTGWSRTPPARLLLPVPPLQDPLNGHRQVVVEDPPGDPAEVVEGADVAEEESLLLLGREGHREQPTRVAQPLGAPSAPEKGPVF